MAQVVPRALERLILAGVFALAAVLVRPALASPRFGLIALAPAETVVRASLSIDTNEAGPEGPIIHERLDEVGNEQLHRAEVLPGHGSDPQIRLKVRALGGEPGYVISSGLYVDDQPLADSTHETECRLCTETEAVEHGKAEIERLVPFVRDRVRATATMQPAGPPSPSPRKDGTPPLRRSLGPGGKAGIGLLGLGGGAVGVGLFLTLKPARPYPENPLYEVSTRPSGLVTLGLGTATLIVGAVLYGLDRRPPPRRVTWLPHAGRASVGLTLAGSF